jgi:hypothetical protein
MPDALVRVFDASARAREGLAHRLEQELRARFRDVRLEVTDYGIILRGRVPTYHAKQLAQHLVMQRTELRIVANEIDVH